MSIAAVMQLESSELLSLSVVTDPSQIDVGNGEHYRLDTKLSFAKSEGENLFRVTFGIRIYWTPEMPFRFKEIQVELDAIFGFPKDMAGEEIAKYFPIVCMASMTGVMRGYISQATGPCPGGAYTLPLLNVHELFKQWKEAERIEVKALQNKTGSVSKKTTAKKKPNVKKRPAAKKKAKPRAKHKLNSK